MVYVRKATESDIDALAVLFDQYRVFYKQKTDIPSARKFLLERMKQQESVIFIALLDEKPAGFTQLYPIFSSVSMQRTWLLNDLYVDEQARKAGVGARLLNAARQYGIETGAKWLLLQTQTDNKAAQALYEKNGWKKMDDIFYELPLV